MLPGPFHSGACLYSPSENTCFTLWSRSKRRRWDQRPASRCFGHICVVYMNAKGTYIKYYQLWKIYVLNHSILMSLLKYISAFGDNFENLLTISQQFCKPPPDSKFHHILAINSTVPCRYVSEGLSRAPTVHAMDLTPQDQTLPISPLPYKIYK